MLNESSDEEIVNAFSTNCMGTIFCTRAAAPVMKNGGHVINISSGAVDSKYPGMSVYAASKAGMEVFSGAMFTELQPLGIKVTALRCGQMVEDNAQQPLHPNVKTRRIATMFSFCSEIRIPLGNNSQRDYSPWVLKIIISSICISYSPLQLYSEVDNWERF